MLNSIQSYFHNIGLKEATPNVQSEQTVIDWVLCSMHLGDIVLIAPEMLNDISLVVAIKEYQLNELRKSTLIVHIIGLMATKENIVPLLVIFLANKDIIIS